MSHFIHEFHKFYLFIHEFHKCHLFIHEFYELNLFIYESNLFIHEFPLFINLCSIIQEDEQVPWPALHLEEDAPTDSGEFTASPADPWGGWKLHTPPPSIPSPAPTTTNPTNSTERAMELINIPIVAATTPSPFRRYELPLTNHISVDNVITKR